MGLFLYRIIETKGYKMTTCYKEKDQTPHAWGVTMFWSPPRTCQGWPPPTATCTSYHLGPLAIIHLAFRNQGDQSGDDGKRRFPWEELLNGWLCVLDPSLLATESTPEDKHGPWHQKEHSEWPQFAELSEKHPWVPEVWEKWKWGTPLA